ncbi:MAG TPA: hypothetical protein VHK24_00095 [Steroidobacter sp.]|nr:hypothetical protein [Steroidobacter sp.]
MTADRLIADLLAMPPAMRVTENPICSSAQAKSPFISPHQPPRRRTINFS